MALKRDVILNSDLDSCQKYCIGEGLDKKVRDKYSSYIKYYDEPVPDPKPSSPRDSSIPVLDGSSTITTKGLYMDGEVLLTDGALVFEIYTDQTLIFRYRCPDGRFHLRGEMESPIKIAEGNHIEIQYDDQLNEWTINGYKSVFNEDDCTFEIFNPAGEVVSSIKIPQVFRTNTPDFLTITYEDCEVIIDHVDRCEGHPTPQEENLCQICIDGVIVENCPNGTICDGSGNCIQDCNDAIVSSNITCVSNGTCDLTISVQTVDGKNYELVMNGEVFNIVGDGTIQTFTVNVSAAPGTNIYSNLTCL